jgi:hypothetical protein
VFPKRHKRLTVGLDFLRPHSRFCSPCAWAGRPTIAPRLRQARGQRPTDARESRSDAAASPPGSCPRGRGHRGRASPVWPSWSRRCHEVTSSLSPAVPPACYKQRSRAVCSGQSRSLRHGEQLGPSSRDLAHCSNPKLHGMQGVTAGIGLAVPTGRSGPVRRDQKRPRRTASAFGADQ